MLILGRDVIGSQFDSMEVVFIGRRGLFNYKIGGSVAFNIYDSMILISLL